MTARRPRATPATLLVIAALAGIEGLWLAWFLGVPLVNAAAVGAQLSRSSLLWKALPELIPGVTWAESHLGAAVGKLSHVENLPQRLPIALAAGLIAGAAVALGGLVLRALRLRGGLTPFERVPLAFALGAAGLGVLTLLAGRLGLLAPWPVRIGLAGLILVELGWGLKARRFPARALGEGTPPPPLPGEEGIGPTSHLTRGRALRWLGFALVVGPFLVLMLLGAMLPTIEFDALEYHLQGPKEYFQAGRITFLPHNVYTSMPFGVEMLHLLGMEVLDDWWTGALAGQVLVMLHAPAAAALIGLSAQRLAGPRAAWIAAVAYLTAPWVVRLAVTPFVEGPLCLYHAALIWVATGQRTEGNGQRAEGRGQRPDARGRKVGGGERRPEDQKRRVEDRIQMREDPPTASRHLPPSSVWPLPPALCPLPPARWLVAGLLAGGALGCKYPALISAVLPFGMVAAVTGIRRRSWAIPMAYAAGVALLAGPWLLRNAIDTGNPVYPLAYRIFGGRDWDPALEAKWSAAHGPRPATLGELGKALLDVAGRSDWQSPLFLALAPLALLRPGTRRAAVALGVYAAYLFATWWLLTHRVDRFWIPMLPALAILAGLGADWTGGRAWSAVLGIVVAVAVVSNLVFVTTDLAGSTRWTDDLATLRTEVPALVNPPLARLNTALPEGARVLIVGQAAVFPVRHAVVYNTVFDHETIELIARDPATGGLRPPAAILRALRDRGISHVYVDWSEIGRYRRPGNYGYTDFVTTALFERLMADGVLDPLGRLGPQHEWYRVRGKGPGAAARLTRDPGRRSRRSTFPPDARDLEASGARKQEMP